MANKRIEKTDNIPEHPANETTEDQAPPFDLKAALKRSFSKQSLLLLAAAALCAFLCVRNARGELRWKNVIEGMQALLFFAAWLFWMRFGEGEYSALRRMFITFAIILILPSLFLADKPVHFTFNRELTGPEQSESVASRTAAAATKRPAATATSKPTATARSTAAPKPTATEAQEAIAVNARETRVGESFIALLEETKASPLSYEEATALRNETEIVLFDYFAASGTELPQGRYVVGEDIPEGNYVITTKSDHSLLSIKIEVRNSLQIVTMEAEVSGKQQQYVPLSVGDTLYISSDSYLETPRAVIRKK